MRIYLKLNANNQPVPFDHLPALVGSIHKWLGPNYFHDDLSLYSFSWLQGSQARANGLYFPKGGSFFISAFREEVIRNILKGIMQNPEVNWGMKVTEVVMQETPAFKMEQRFQVASPVLVKRRVGEREQHYTFSDKEVNDLLTETLHSKLEKAGMRDETLSVKFDRSYHKPKTKKVNYKGIGNMANVCPVIVQGKPESVAFAWNVGVGNSTGIGLGALV